MRTKVIIEYEELDNGNVDVKIATEPLDAPFNHIVFSCQHFINALASEGRSGWEASAKLLMDGARKFKELKNYDKVLN